MSNIRRFSAVEPDVAKQAEVEKLLAELREISKNEIGKLIPYFEKADTKGMASEADEKSPIALADRKAKIGVAFGVYPYSQERKHFGSKYRSKKAVLCKIYRYSHDKLGMLAPIQRAWVAALAEHYKQVLAQSGDSEDVPARVHHILQKLQGFDDRLASGGRMKGAEFTVLIPPDARHQIIKDYIEALIEGGKGVTSSPKGEEALKQLAIFVVPEDPFPYVWQKPEQANAEGQHVSDPSLGEQLDDSRFVQFDWSNAEDLNGFLSQPIQGESAHKPVITTDPNTGKSVRQHQSVDVYDAESNSAYAQKKHDTQKLLEQLRQRRLVHFTKDRVSTSFIDTYAKPSAKNISHFFTHIQQPDVLGPLVVKSEDGRSMLDTYKGIVAADILLNMDVFDIRRDLDGFEKAYKAGIQARRAYKQALENNNQEEADKHNAVVQHSEIQVNQFIKLFAGGAPSAETARVLWMSLQAYRKYQNEQESLRTHFESDVPSSTLDNAMWEKGLMPSLEQNPVAFTEKDGKPVALRFQADKNPFYTPKVFIDDLKKVQLPNRAAKIEWPAAGGSLMPKGYDTNWKAMSYQERSAKIREMEEAAVKLPSGSGARGKYMSSLAYVKSCQFLDDLSKYVKETLAFNFQSTTGSKAAAMVEAPPLFYKTDFDGNQQAVTMRDLLLRSKEEDETDEILAHNPLKEDPNFGFAYDVHADIRAMIQGQMAVADEDDTKEASAVVVRLLQSKKLLAQLAEGETPDIEVFFDMEGEQYDSLNALATKLGEGSDAIDPEQVQQITNKLIDQANAELSVFKHELDSLIARIEMKLQQSKQVVAPVEAPQVNKKIQMPPQQPANKLVDDSIPELDTEPQLVAARLIKKFTKR